MSLRSNRMEAAEQQSIVPRKSDFILLLLVRMITINYIFEKRLFETGPIGNVRRNLRRWINEPVKMKLSSVTRRGILNTLPGRGANPRQPGNLQSYTFKYARMFGKPNNTGEW